MISVESGRPERVFFDVLHGALIGISAIVCGIGFYIDSVYITILGLCGVAVLLYAKYVEPHWISTVHYRQALVSDPQRWIKMVFLSDLHAGLAKNARYYERVARLAAEEKPDLFILGGDAVEERADAIKDLESFKDLTAKYGTYFILGNHDYLDRPVEVREALSAWGYQNITNKTSSLCVDDRPLDLVGIDDTWFGKPVFPSSEKQRAPRLVIAHEPDALLDMQEGDADLVLLGHTHGGQVRLPWLGAVRPLPQMAPQWLDRGRKEWRKIPVIISQGLGEADAPVRLFCRPQIVVVEIGI